MATIPQIAKFLDTIRDKHDESCIDLEVALERANICSTCPSFTGHKCVECVGCNGRTLVDRVLNPYLDCAAMNPKWEKYFGSE